MRLYSQTKSPTEKEEANRHARKPHATKSPTPRSNFLLASTLCDGSQKKHNSSERPQSSSIMSNFYTNGNKNGAQQDRYSSG